MRGTARLLMMLGAGCGDAEVRPQLVTHFDTDAPLAGGLGLDRQPPLFDTLRVEVLAGDGSALACDGCVRFFNVDEALVREARASIGLVAETALRLRATLYAAERIDAEGRPVVSTAVDVASELRVVGSELLDQRIDMPMARTGIAADPMQPDPAVPGVVTSSQVGSWPGARRTPCPTPPSPGSGADDEENCVAGGAFVMGSRRVVGTGIGTDADQLRVVTIAPFFLDTHEYTVRRFRAAVAKGFSGASPYLYDANPEAKNHYCTYSDAPLGPAEERHPLTCVTWLLASTLCAFEGRRLPTEAEWEFEASGRGESREYPWGDSLPECNQAIFARAGAGFLSENSSKCVDQGQPEGHAPVGSAPGDRSVSGALDLAGGVGEWVLDIWNRQEEPCWSATTLYDNPRCELPSPLDGPARSIRGGSWTYAEDGLRVARRFFAVEGADDVSVGFRCARDGGASAP